MKSPLLFAKKVLFIEFFIREYQFYGKGDVRTQLPPDAFFYTGKSKAMGYKEQVKPPMLGFDCCKPFLSEEIQEDIKEKIFKDNTNIVAIAASESVDQNNNWWKKESKLFSNKTGVQGNQGQLPYANFKSLSPYGFNIADVKTDGTIETDFPREGIMFSIAPQQTVCFLCRREERGDGEWYMPNLNLVLFVKNHGLHESIEFRSQAEISRMNNRLLCDEKFGIRDFRKSSLNFQLG